MRPRSKKDSELQHNFQFPHDAYIGVNSDEALRIAKKRWKRNRSKHLRQLDKKECLTNLED